MSKMITASGCLLVGLLMALSSYYGTRAFLLENRIYGFLPIDIIVKILLTILLVGIGSFMLGKHSGGIGAPAEPFTRRPPT
jgi:hypothetical protein